MKLSLLGITLAIKEKHSAGFCYFTCGNFIHHFFVKKKLRQWGYSEDWCDGPLYSFGLGWFYLCCWTESFYGD